MNDGKVIRLPSSVATVPPELAKTLEQAWQRRREELAGWQPSGGWLIDQQASHKQVALHVAHGFRN
jgi:hypothetical protein